MSVIGGAVTIGSTYFVVVVVDAVVVVLVVVVAGVVVAGQYSSHVGQKPGRSSIHPCQQSR